MRACLPLVLGLFFLGACARPGARDAGTGDAGAGRDAPAIDSPRTDGGGSDAPRTDAPSADARIDTGGDAGRTDGGGTDGGGTDGGASDGGASDGGTDARVVGMPGSSCFGPIDVSASGTYSVDTCAFSNFVASGCGNASAFDVVLGGASPLSGSSYGVRVPPGWVIDQTDSLCEASSFSCSATGTYFVTGTRGDPFWYFVISRADGDCGVVDVVIERTM